MLDLTTQARLNTGQVRSILGPEALNRAATVSVTTHGQLVIRLQTPIPKAYVTSTLSNRKQIVIRVCFGAFSALKLSYISTLTVL